MVLCFLCVGGGKCMMHDIGVLVLSMLQYRLMFWLSYCWCVSIYECTRSQSKDGHTHTHTCLCTTTQVMPFLLALMDRLEADKKANPQVHIHIIISVYRHWLAHICT